MARLFIAFAPSLGVAVHVACINPVKGDCNAINQWRYEIQRTPTPHGL